MKVSDAMSRSVRIASPNHSIRVAALAMADADIGVLPVGDGDRLVGMITDRDIAVRAVAAGMSPDTPVREVMSTEVCYCFDDQDLEEVADNMGEIKVRRLPVVNRDKRIVGFVALSNIAQSNSESAREALLAGVATPH